jgi:hypothetical protein
VAETLDVDANTSSCQCWTGLDLLAQIVVKMSTLLIALVSGMTTKTLFPLPDFFFPEQL